MFIKSINKEIILKPLQTIIGIVEKKQTLPVLSNVLLERDLNNLRFTATDLEMQITTSVALDNEEGVFSSLTIPGKKFQEIIRVLPEGSKLSIENKEQKVEIKSQKSRFSLQTLPAQDFPKLNIQTESTVSVAIEQKTLKDLLVSVQCAMAQQDVRYYLNGMLLVLEGNELKVVSTDGHRLAFNKIVLKNEYEKQDVILPRKFVTELCKLLSDTKDEVEIIFSKQQAMAIFSGVTLVTKVIDGKFPDYERVIPKHKNYLDINRIVIQQAFQRAAILSNEKFRGIRIVLTEKNLSIISNNSEQEEAQEDLETNYHGEALDIGFNVNYLLDGLNSTVTENIRIYFGDSNSSILMAESSDSEQFCYVVMPMRI